VQRITGTTGMADSILELYPNPGQRHALKGLYLGQLAGLPQNDTPFIY